MRENASSEDGNPQKHAFGGQGQTVTVATAHGLGDMGPEEPQATNQET